MSRIRGDQLKPETAVGDVLRSLRFKPDRNAPDLPGRPDYVLRRRKVAVFVHGCFWHCCPRHHHVPKSNQKFWTRKFEGNRRRDRRVARKLRQAGWSVVIVWEHDTKLDADRLRRLIKHRLLAVERRQQARP